MLSILSRRVVFTAARAPVLRPSFTVTRKAPVVLNRGFTSSHSVSTTVPKPATKTTTAAAKKPSTKAKAVPKKAAPKAKKAAPKVKKPVTRKVIKRKPAAKKPKVVLVAKSAREFRVPTLAAAYLNIMQAC